jgi:hypothetical protein
MSETAKCTYKVILTVLTLLLLAIPGFLLYSNIVDAGGAKPLPPKQVKLAAPKDDNYGTPAEVSPTYPANQHSYFCVTFELLGLDPSISFVDLGFLVGVTKYGQQHLPAKYKNISLWVTSYSGLGSIRIPISVATLRHAPASTCGSGLVASQCPQYPGGNRDIICSAELDQDAAFRSDGSYLILGQAQAFPQDWYQLDDSVAVREGLDIDGTHLRSSLLMMTRDESFTTTVHLDDKSLHDWSFQHQLMFTVRRPLRVVLYTYLISSLPFFLLIAILVRQWVVKKNMPKPYEVAFGVAATLLAILSLRTVLVPSALPALTRLDIIFGIGVTILVVGSIIWMGIWGSDDDGTADDMTGTPHDE